MKNKRRSLFLPLFLIWLTLLLALAVFAAVRYSLLAKAEADGLQALYRLLWEVIPAATILLLSGIAGAVCFIVYVVKPVGRIKGSVTELSKRVSGGEPHITVEAQGCLAELSEALAAEEEKVCTLLDTAIKETDEQAKKREKLSAARAIAAATAPDRLAFGGLTYGVCARTEHCEDFGADFCDSFQTDKRHIFFAVGDVWGQGLAASLFAAKLRNILREKIAGGSSPAEALAAVNRSLLEGNRETLAATLFCALFNFDSGELRYANAGHLPPLIAGEQVGFLRARAGTPLGLYADATFTDETFTLTAGQGLFAYTDGVVNVSNGKEVFGYDRLLSTLRQYYGSALNADSVADGVVNAALSFGNAEDDLSAFALYFPAGVQRLLKPELSELEKMRELLDHWLSEDPRKKNIQLACEEIFTNIVNHAGAKAIQIGCEKEESSLIIRFTDDGEPFNPLQAENGSKEFYSYAEGGMGMTIIRRIAGEIFYRTKQNLNVLTVRFPVIKGYENK